MAWAKPRVLSSARCPRPPRAGRRTPTPHRPRGRFPFRRAATIRRSTFPDGARPSGSMEVVGRHARERFRQGRDLSGAYRDDPVLVLKPPGHEEERLLDQGEPIAVEEGRAHDDV